MRTLAVLIVLSSWHVLPGNACPACYDRGKARQTMLDRVLSSPKAVIAAPQTGKRDRFEVIEVLKGDASLKGEIVRVEAFGKPLNRLMLPAHSLLTYHTTSQRWLKQTVLTLSQDRFLKRALKAPATDTLDSHTQRLAFFQPYLNHLDPLIAESATQEWARAPYTVIRTCSKLLDQEVVRKHLDSEEPHPLYYILLGLCGTEEDQAFLTQSLKQPRALAAKLTALLELQGAPTLDWIVTTYLKNSERKFEEIKAAIDAIGIHGTANEAIPRTKAQQALRSLFELHPKHVAQAAPYFEEWQDWSMQELYRSLKSNDPKIQAYLSASLRASH